MSRLVRTTGGLLQLTGSMSPHAQRTVALWAHQFDPRHFPISQSQPKAPTSLSHRSRSTRSARLEPQDLQDPCFCRR